MLAEAHQTALQELFTKRGCYERDSRAGKPPVASDALVAMILCDLGEEVLLTRAHYQSSLSSSP
jgi:hypothetical protein